MYFDIIYLFFPIPAISAAVWAMVRIRAARIEGDRVVPQAGPSGFELSNHLMRLSGSNDVAVMNVEGPLTNLFDASNQVIRLSNEVYSGRSMSSLAVAAHEASFALGRQGFAALIRCQLRRFAIYGSSLFWLTFLSSLVLTNVALFLLSILLFSLNVGLQLLGLPLEFAADRAGASHLSGMLNCTAAEQQVFQKNVHARSFQSLALTLVGLYEEAISPLLTSFSDKQSSRSFPSRQAHRDH